MRAGNSSAPSSLLAEGAGGHAFLALEAQAEVLLGAEARLRGPVEKPQRDEAFEQGIFHHAESEDPRGKLAATRWTWLRGAALNGVSSPFHFVLTKENA